MKWVVLISWMGCAQKPETQSELPPALQLDSTTLGIRTIASNLNVPWEIAWGPDNMIWFTEQSGTVSRIDPETGKKQLLLTIPGVHRERTMGLLGMAVRKLQDGNVYAYVDYTFKKDTTISSRLVRYILKNDTLVDPQLLLEIPGGIAHNGSRVAFAPDGSLLWSTGDIFNGNNAQDPHSLNGKILRFNADGTIPADNPIAGSPVWAWGFRNIQGITASSNGNIFTSEHGDATDDEVNLIKAGQNYGWPVIQGYPNRPEEKTTHAFIPPKKVWTPTIAPSGMDYYHSPEIPEWNNCLLLANLKDQSLRVLRLDSTQSNIVNELVFLKDLLGRIRDICVSPEGDVYLSTSNRDWNPSSGFPKHQDDRIIKISATGKNLTSAKTPAPPALADLYTMYCASCHKADGAGLPGTYPALKSNAMVLGDTQMLTRLLITGKGQMPAFDFLSDQELATIINQVRSSWDNHAPAITPDEVKQARVKF